MDIFKKTKDFWPEEAIFSYQSIFSSCFISFRAVGRWSLSHLSPDKGRGPSPCMLILTPTRILESTFNLKRFFLEFLNIYKMSSVCIYWKISLMHKIQSTVFSSDWLTDSNKQKIEEKKNISFKWPFFVLRTSCEIFLAAYCVWICMSSGWMWWRGKEERRGRQLSRGRPFFGFFFGWRLKYFPQITILHGWKTWWKEQNKNLLIFLVFHLSYLFILSPPPHHRLLHLLPSENLLLLRHVIAVLHCIQGNAHDNQMNAFNLSVCIAPSMLWPPAPSSPEMEGEAAKKVRKIPRRYVRSSMKLLVSIWKCLRKRTSLFLQLLYI